MEKDLEIVQASALFRNISLEEIAKMIHCLQCSRRSFGRNQILWHAGEKITSAGIVLRGTVDALQYELDGSVRMVARHRAGGMIGDLLVASGDPSPVTLQMAEVGEILFIPLESILSGCPNCCPAHVQLRRNLLETSAGKYWQLRRKLRFLSEPSLRRRIVLYLEEYREKYNSMSFSVPDQREGMAMLLGVNRSALSRELSRMEKEGLLTYHRKEFTLSESSWHTMVDAHLYNV